MAEPLFFDVRALAREFNVKPATIRAWRKRGILPPPLKIGRLLRWRRADIEAMNPTAQ